jgi:hypothetical protein
MADPRHLARLKQGVPAWNAWRRRYPKLVPDLSRALLIDLDLRGINLTRAHLARANLRQTTLSLANLTRANLHRADLRAASLRRAKLDHANLTGAILRHASLAEVSLDGATLTGCEIYGIAAWNLKGTPKDQSNLIIRATREEPTVTVDDLEVAQFVYLLLHNEKIRSVIDTVGRKAVLLLGRFTAERKALLDALRDELRARGYVPMLFDFDQPSGRDLTETIVTLAHMSRFIIADLTDPKSVPQELTAIIPDLPSVPVVPVVLAGQKEYPLFEHWKRYPWVLPVLRYKNGADLLGRLQKSVIEKAEGREPSGRPARRPTASSEALIEFDVPAALGAAPSPAQRKQLTQRGVEALQRLRAGAELLLGQAVEGRVRGVKAGVEIFRLRVHIQQAGDHLALGVVVLQEVDGRYPVARIVIGGELAQAQHRAVVLHDLLQHAGGVVGGDRLARHHDVQAIYRLVVLSHIVIALGRPLVVVEGHAR